LGVVACISPWNFPLAIFIGQVTGALAAGNTVVAKPAEQTPLIAMLATRLLHEAGVPVSALQLLTGDGRIGAALVGHTDIAAVCFTGSMATAKAIAALLARTGRAALPFIAETGGINAMIVDSSSLPDQVVRDVLTAAFQSAGQRCSALRILCVQRNIADRVVELLRGAVDTLQIGDPGQLDTDVGPLIDADASRQVRAYLEGRTVLAASQLDAAHAARGWFVAPTIIEVSSVSDVQQEVFGPVLHLVRFDVSELPKLVLEINRQGYGLTLGIHSRIRRRINGIIDATSTGNIYVNRHQVGAVVGQQPFGGHGLSGTGPKAGGPHYLLRLSQGVAMAVGQSSKVVESMQPIGAQITTLLAVARQAQSRWQQTARRAELVQFARQLLAANSSQSIGSVAASLRAPGAADFHVTLASIAGESNHLHLLPRGVLLCLSALSDPVNSLCAQILIAVATGNAALVLVNAERAQSIRELIALLQQSGVPEDLIACIEMPHAHLPIAWLMTPDIDGVVFDGSDSDAHRIAAHLQERQGPLIPLLSSTVEAYRFCLEQTVTVNTAAAGGDPHLLGMAT
jgi:RHH-type proline utilization regulon transcriptional repressor/proline dehydrogenase/delta 1-pyrroline-5-carboxylate dehydrogenase